MCKKEDSSISFGIGILMGVIGGVVGALLFTPKKGDEMREELKDAAIDIAQKCRPEIIQAKKQALASIDMVKFQLEKQYNKVNETIKAKQLAKAKELEGDESYDF